MAITSVAYPLSKLQQRMARGIMRDDLAADSNNYADYLNMAIRELENLKSWSFMKVTSSLVFPANQLSVAMPDNFKEFTAQKDKSPVNQILNDPDVPGALKPVRLGFNSQELMRLWKFSTQVASFGFFGIPTLVFDRGESGYTLNLTVPNIQDLDLQLNYYAYSAPLTAPTDTNPMTEMYPEMVICLAKSLAFEDINDPAAADMANIALTKFKLNAHQDARSDLQGRDLHM